MRVEGWLFLGCGVFFLGADVVYWYTSYDPTGTVALALAVCLAVLAGFYVLFVGRRIPPRPEDSPEGEIVEGTGEIGFFSPHSWWPLFLGFSCAIFAVGFAVLTGFYVLFTGRRLPLRPEDNNEAEIADGTGEIGFFSPHSWGPLFLGLAAATTALGAAVGWWLFLIGLLSTVYATIGFVFEYYRGHFSH